MRVIAAKATAFKQAMTYRFKVYQERVLENARVVITVLPEPRTAEIISGGTDSHMFLVDLRAKNITGKDAEAALSLLRTLSNKNAIPNDPQKPFADQRSAHQAPLSHPRLQRDRMRELAHLIADVLDAPHDAKTQKRVAAGVKTLTAKFPVYR